MKESVSGRYTLEGRDVCMGRKSVRDRERVLQCGREREREYVVKNMIGERM